VLSSVAAGIGAAAVEGVPALIGGVVAALLGWVVWAWLTYFIGTPWHATTSRPTVAVLVR
jgi:hypothetical protein